MTDRSPTLPNEIGSADKCNSRPPEEILLLLRFSSRNLQTVGSDPSFWLRIHRDIVSARAGSARARRSTTVEKDSHYCWYKKTSRLGADRHHKGRIHSCRNRAQVCTIHRHRSIELTGAHPWPVRKGTCPRRIRCWKGSDPK